MQKKDEREGGRGAREKGKEEEKKVKVRKEGEFLCCYTPHTLVPVMALMKVQFSCTSSEVTTSASPVEVS